MTIAALVIALIALLIAFFALRRAGSLQERLDRSDSALYELRSALKATNQQLDEKISDLKLSMRRQAGEEIFRPEMTIAEAMEVHPRVGEVLAAFHLGGCSQCAVSEVDTIEGACQSYGIDQQALMQALNGLVTGGMAWPVKTLNVQLSF
ncbi:MAG: hypothetical protein ACUVR4_10395 [Anaerolineae bacterium]